MAKKLSRNAPCPCGSGKKYKHCCIRKDFEWVEMDDGSIAKRIELPQEMADAFEELRKAFVAQHGREPDRIFEGAPPFEQLEHWTVEAMKKANVDPALIYAFEKTNGLLLNERNLNKVPDSDIAAWDAAISEYESKTGKRAMQRLISEQDFETIMLHGPKTKTKSSSEFVSRLPFPPPFPKDEWLSRSPTSVVEDPICFGYLERCMVEIKRSGRATTYLDMFTVLVQLDDPANELHDYAKLLQDSRGRDFSIDELRHGLEALIEIGQPKGILTTAAAAFEFLGIVGDFMNRYVEESGIGDELADEIQRVNGIAILAFIAAVNVELGVADDVWDNSRS